MDYLKQRRAKKQAERLWSIGVYSLPFATAVIFINSLIQMAYVY